jgi:hypothetical protein
MGLFDNLESQAEAIAGKAGISPDQVKAISSTLQAKLGDGSDQMTALKQTAAEHGIPVDKIQEVLNHAGSSDDLASEIGGLAKGLLG